MQLQLNKQLRSAGAPNFTRILLSFLIYTEWTELHFAISLKAIALHTQQLNFKNSFFFFSCWILFFSIFSISIFSLFVKGGDS